MTGKILQDCNRWKWNPFGMKHKDVIWGVKIDNTKLTVGERMIGGKNKKRLMGCDKAARGVGLDIGV